MADKSITRSKEENWELRQIKECVSLIKHTLYSAYYQNRWPVVDLKQIISRLSMLIQERCVIVLLEVQEDIGYTILNHSCLDPFWKDDFEKYIKYNLYQSVISQYYPSDKLIVLDKDKAKSFEIEIGNGKERSKYCIDIRDYLIKFHYDKYFMIHKMGSTKDDYPDEPDDTRYFDPIPVSRSGNIRKTNKLDKNLSRVLLELSKQLAYDHKKNKRIKDIFNSRELSKMISDKRIEWKNHKIIRKLPERKNLESYIGADNVEEFLNPHFEEIRKIFGKEYKKIRESPLLNDAEHIPNIVFFVRSFSQNTTRFYNSYHYSVRVLIPEEQRKDLRIAFKNLADKYSNTPKNRPKISDASGNNIDDDFFWDLINEPDGKGIEDLFKLLDKPNQLYARSMSDSVFESGYINIKNGPFKFGGESRLEKKELDKKSESEGYRRSVCFHHLLSSVLSPQSDKLSADFSVLLAPNFIGGSPFSCTGFVFEHKHEKDDKHKDILPLRSWMDNYHFYYSICHYLTLSLRNSLMTLYLYEIRKIYENKQDTILNKIVNGETFHKEEICELLNPRLETLCRIYPFGHIELRPEIDSQIKSYNFEIEGYAGGNASLLVYIHDNPFFIRNIAGGPFLGETKIKKCLIIANQNLEKKLMNKFLWQQNTNTEASDNIN